MKAGDLNQRVTLQELQTGQDSIGAPFSTWVDVATLWADVRYASGLSTIKAGTDTAIVKASIRLRYRAFNPAQRLVHDGKTFSIEAVLPDSKKVYVDLVCEVKNAGT